MLAIKSHQASAVELLLEKGQSSAQTNKKKELPLARNLGSVTEDTVEADSKIFELLVSIASFPTAVIICTSRAVGK